MSMNAVSRERFTPAAAADAVILTCLRAPAPSILWLAPSLTRNECIVFRVSSIIVAVAAASAAEQVFLHYSIIVYWQA